MSSGDTSSAPSVTDRPCFAGLYQTELSPSFFAVSTVSFTPTCSMSCANTVLIDSHVARRNVVDPPPWPSELPIGLQLVDTRPWHAFGRYSPGAGKTLSGDTPCDRAVASVNALNAEPGCLPPPPPSTTLPVSQHVAGISTFAAAKSAGLGGQPPSARFT